MISLEDLRKHPLIKEFADCYDNEELYDIISKTNPTLKFAVDISKKVIDSGKNNNDDLKDEVPALMCT